jgi:hypothetical protein
VEPRRGPHRVSEVLDRLRLTAGIDHPHTLTVQQLTPTRKCGWSISLILKPVTGARRWAYRVPSF